MGVSTTVMCHEMTSLVTSWTANKKFMPGGYSPDCTGTDTVQNELKEVFRVFKREGEQGGLVPFRGRFCSVIP